MSDVLNTLEARLAAGDKAIADLAAANERTEKVRTLRQRDAEQYLAKIDHLEQALADTKDNLDETRIVARNRLESLGSLHAGRGRDADLYVSQIDSLKASMETAKRSLADAKASTAQDAATIKELQEVIAEQKRAVILKDMTIEEQRLALEYRMDIIKNGLSS
jgi:chromosome segregation ATPase